MTKLFIRLIPKPDIPRKSSGTVSDIRNRFPEECRACSGQNVEGDQVGFSLCIIGKIFQGFVKVLGHPDFSFRGIGKGSKIFIFSRDYFCNRLAGPSDDNHLASLYFPEQFREMGFRFIYADFPYFHREIVPLTNVLVKFGDFISGFPAELALI